MGTADADKKDFISEYIRQLEDIKIYLELTEKKGKKYHHVSSK